MKPKIMVVGLLPAQAGRVERDCGGVAVLKFCTGQKNGPLLGQADHCVVMVKFVNHGHSRKALRMFPRERVHYNRGGLSELMQTINHIAGAARNT